MLLVCDFAPLNLRMAVELYTETHSTHRVNKEHTAHRVSTTHAQTNWTGQCKAVYQKQATLLKRALSLNVRCSLFFIFIRKYTKTSISTIYLIQAQQSHSLTWPNAIHHNRNICLIVHNIFKDFSFSHIWPHHWFFVRVYLSIAFAFFVFTIDSTDKSNFSLHFHLISLFVCKCIWYLILSDE